MGTRDSEKADRLFFLALPLLSLLPSHKKYVVLSTCCVLSACCGVTINKAKQIKSQKNQDFGKMATLF